MISLENKSYFSLGESLMSPAALVTAAKEGGYDAVALADVMTISGMVEFSKKAKELEIKPVIGATLRIFDDPTYRPPSKKSGEEILPNHEWRCKVFVKNDQGMHDLMQLLTKAYSDEYFYKHARLGLNDLTDALSKGNLVFSSGFEQSLFAHKNAADIFDEILIATHTRTEALWEITALNTPLHDRVNKETFARLNGMGATIVSSMPTLYDSKDKAESLDVLKVIIQNNKMNDPWIHKRFLKSLEPKSWIEMEEATTESLKRIGKEGELEAIMELMSKLPDYFEYEWHKMPISLPEIAQDETRALLNLIKKGIKERLYKPVLGYQPSDEDIKNKYLPRIKYEMDILQQMGFVRYFLLTRDVISWSRENGVKTGPGRGCFSPDMSVRLSNGSAKKINEIMIGDEVASHDGSFNKVIDLLSYDVDEELVVLTMNDGREIKCTKDHEIHTQNRGWIRADDLTEFDEITEI